MPTSPTRARQAIAVGQLPLRLRLPNAPPIFVGRASEADALEAAIRRAPLSCIWGVGGLGKSALAFHVLQTRFADEAERTLVLRLTGGDALDEGLLVLAQTLAEAQGVTGIDWRSLIKERDALVATAIDLAEGAASSKPARRKGRPFWIVIDDVHHAEPARAAEVFAQLAGYARKSRWIAVGRTNPAPELVLGQSIALGAMSEPELRALGRSWGASTPDDRAIAAAAGSPWRLKQLVGGVDPGIEPGAGDPLNGLAPAVATFLGDLSIIDAELPEEILARFTEVPSEDAMAALERRALVERRALGVRLHDVARSFVAARIDPSTLPERRRRAAVALALHPDAGVWLGALRLFVDLGDADRAAAALDERGARLLETGNVLGLWRILERAIAPELASWRLRCAIEIGDPPTLRGIPAPSSPSLADRTRIAVSLFQQGRYEDAAVAGASAQEAARAAGDVELTFEAGRVTARSSFDRGLFDRALECFEAQVPATRRQEAQRNIDIAACLTSTERLEAGRGLIEKVEAALAEDPSIGDRSIQRGIAWVLYQIGDLHGAARAAGRLAAFLDGVPLHGLASAHQLILFAGLAYDRGALGEASELVDKLLPQYQRSSAHALFAGIQRVQLRLVRGEFSGLREDLDALLDAASRSPRDDLGHTARSLLPRAALALGEPPTREAPIAVPNESRWGDLHLLWDIVHRARWAPIEGDSAIRSLVPEVTLVASIAEAMTRLARGEIDRSAAIARDAAMRASRAGYGVLEVYARDVELEAQLISDAPAATVVECASTLASLAREREMTPHVARAELALLCADSERFDPRELERIAAIESAPGRMARALLGDDVVVDRVAIAMIAAARRRTRIAIASIVRAEPSAPGWGLDERTKTVWLPDRTCSLAEKSLLWRILSVIADHAGSADKEALVTGAWQQASYHPLRDDARLHTAVRTLRREIEDDPKEPTRLVTTETGYAFGPGAHVRRLVVHRT